MTPPIDSVLLLAFGGPTSPAEIRPFLRNVARGRSIPAERLEEVARHYERLPGGRSPLNDLTHAQARALAGMLERQGLPLPVFVGMRNWHPYLGDTLAAMAGRGLHRALGVILSSLRTEASWDRYQRDVEEARAGPARAPEVVFAPPFSRHPRFLDAVADRGRRALGEVPAEGRASTPLVFTAHSIPVAMAEASPYVVELTEAARGVADRLSHPRWSLAYQSRSGRPGERWLEPDIGEVLRRLGSDGERHAVVVPVGFVCDHVEVLYDLDVEARRVAREAGVALHRAEAVNDHPAFIEALADVVVTVAGRGGTPSTAITPRGLGGATPDPPRRPTPSPQR